MRIERAAIDDPGLGERADAVLAASGCIVVPTDTVYGIATRAGDRAGVARLQAIKGRSDAFPPPVLVADPDQAWSLVSAAPPAARRLAAAFWPGALTLVLATPRDDLSLSGAVGTVGLRVPDHAGLRALLRRTGPLATSSANKHNRAPATTVEEAIDQLGDAVGLYIDGGPIPGPAPSSVVDCTSDGIAVLRAGLLTEADLRAVAGGA